MRKVLYENRRQGELLEPEFFSMERMDPLKDSASCVSKDSLGRYRDFLAAPSIIGLAQEELSVALFYPSRAGMSGYNSRHVNC